jgi:hypothetical protein
MERSVGFFQQIAPSFNGRIGQMTGVAREGVIELERPEAGFGSRQWMMISLVAGFRQTLNLIATVRPNALNPDKVAPSCGSQMDLE